LADAWTGNWWVAEELRELGHTVYVARNKRDGRIANDDRHKSREEAERQAEILNSFWGDDDAK
jgi:hypothetical protein